jgi:uncharacterized protein (TIGR02452 family)
MNREQRIENARQTLHIIERGVYQANGREVNIADLVNRSVEATKLYSPEALTGLLEKGAGKIATNRKTVISVTNQTTMEALQETIRNSKFFNPDSPPVLQEMTSKSHTACLNFASAVNPGGGFLTGALAQEECLAAASSLYPSLLKCKEMYDYNHSRKSYLYSDYMIYSPGVVFFKDDNGTLLENPYQADILTSPAANISAMQQSNPAELVYVEQTMLSRIDKMLALFAIHNVKNLILGAWGCGVFQNNPHDIARYFVSFLTGNGKYAGCFHKIVFAVYDRTQNQENFNAFNSTNTGFIYENQI